MALTKLVKPAPEVEGDGEDAADPFGDSDDETKAGKGDGEEGKGASGEGGEGEGEGEGGEEAVKMVFDTEVVYPVGHFNPITTIVFATRQLQQKRNSAGGGAFSAKTQFAWVGEPWVWMYIFMQIMGACMGALVLWSSLASKGQVGATVVGEAAVFWQALVVEILGTFAVMSALLATLGSPAPDAEDWRARKGRAPLVAGAVLVAVSLIAGNISGGSTNPVRVAWGRRGVAWETLFVWRRMEKRVVAVGVWSCLLLPLAPLPHTTRSGLFVLSPIDFSRNPFTPLRLGHHPPIQTSYLSTPLLPPLPTFSRHDHSAQPLHPVHGLTIGCTGPDLSSGDFSPVPPTSFLSRRTPLQWWVRSNRRRVGSGSLSNIYYEPVLLSSSEIRVVSTTGYWVSTAWYEG